MGKWKERICGWMGTICNCVSAAARQAREAEIDIVSKRRFRQILASGEASFALSQEEVTVLREMMARMGVGSRSFLDCLNDAKKSRVEGADSMSLHESSTGDSPSMTSGEPGGMPPHTM